MKLLVKQGASVSYNDPHILRTRMGRRCFLELVSVELTSDALSSVDCVVVVTDHSAYDPEFIVEHARLVIDARNLTGSVRGSRERIVRA